MVVSKPRKLNEYIKLKSVKRYIRKHALSKCRSFPIDYTNTTGKIEHLNNELRLWILNDKHLYQKAKSENVTDLPY